MEVANLIVVLLSLVAFGKSTNNKQFIRNLDERTFSINEVVENRSPIIVVLISDLDLKQRLLEDSRRWSNRPLVEVGPGVFKPDKLKFLKNKYKEEIKQLLEMNSSNKESQEKG